MGVCVSLWTTNNNLTCRCSQILGMFGYVRSSNHTTHVQENISKWGDLGKGANDQVGQCIPLHNFGFHQPDLRWLVIALTYGYAWSHSALDHPWFQGQKHHLQYQNNQWAPYRLQPRHSCPKTFEDLQHLRKALLWHHIQCIKESNYGLSIGNISSTFQRTSNCVGWMAHMINLVAKAGIETFDTKEGSKIELCLPHSFSLIGEYRPPGNLISILTQCEARKITRAKRKSWEEVYTANNSSTV